ncbi:phosphonate metabolism protein/1,5-bisphosphokinase (PRPP-forming) PhnN [Paraburkholderia fynbosensis]|uniref:Ribose 1,5-bisphosphate phosphokinase PhnN n=1 Tax=Paraburkholderia fynbosensis TaxID=1200993 RepID=A0A6J5H2L4_9BURK|nr:phosphonate metabolism protein/1,5-bisphosphokinase (PRPP-forming) PhnN [Paraburkholderia fynbosensis]CAB3809498.1 Ribose 1,5-bisphosphate phosphokinase PhnN [Paraburkholderia fynbosensis]
MSADWGRLIYVMGPSGAGKDSLLGFVRERIGSQVMFAHRYITRPVSEGENHVALTHDEFAARLASGVFSMHWQSHGLHYGIGVEIDAWLARGLMVIVNGSREHAPAALERYPHTQFVHIHANPAVLAARLERRGREDSQQMEARLARRPALVLPHEAQITTIDNSGLLADAGEQLLAAINQPLKLAL